MRVHLSVAACLIALLAQMPPAHAQQPYVGEIVVTGTNFCPAGWLPLNGQLLAISEYDVLFNLIGTTYGGDGQTTFALPAAKPAVSATGAALSQCISLFGIFPTQN